MSDHYDGMSWEEYLRSTDDLKASIDIDSFDSVIDYCVEAHREEYRLAWYDYVSEFE